MKPRHGWQGTDALKEADTKRCRAPWIGRPTGRSTKVQETVEPSVQKVKAGSGFIREAVAVGRLVN